MLYYSIIVSMMLGLGEWAADLTLEGVLGMTDVGIEAFWLGLGG